MARLVFWMNADWLVNATDAQLDSWKNQHVGGFVLQTGRLTDIGGGTTETARRESIRAKQLVQRCATRGIKVYLGTYLTNQAQTGKPPMGDWFDNTVWAKVNASVGSFADLARSVGAAGVAFDSEQYQGQVWDWNYTGNPGQASVRAKVRERGAQVGAQIGDLEIVQYPAEFPGATYELKNSRTGLYTDSTLVDFYAGLVSTPGAAVRFYDQGCYKYKGKYATWDALMSAGKASLKTFWSQRLTGAQRPYYWTPFMWIDNGPDTDEPTMTVADADAEIMAALSHGEGGEVGNFCFRSSFAYAPYVASFAKITAAPTPTPTPTPTPEPTSTGDENLRAALVAILRDAADSIEAL
jgi:hypothetical protein